MIALPRNNNVLGRLSILDWPAVIWRSSQPLGLIPSETALRVEVITTSDDPPPFTNDQRVLVLVAPIEHSVVFMYAKILRVESTNDSNSWRLELQLLTEALDC
jgi:hypothetical protein